MQEENTLEQCELVEESDEIEQDELEVEEEAPVLTFDNYVISFEKGRTYQTRGGWPALVIWISRMGGTMWAIHKPGEPLLESSPVMHNLLSGVAITPFSVHAPPLFEGHPADILLPEEEPGQTAR